MPGAMSATRRIGILTGGGDVPGLNSVIKSVVYRATENGDEVVGIRRGRSEAPGTAMSSVRLIGACDAHRSHPSVGRGQVRLYDRGR